MLREVVTRADTESSQGLHDISLKSKRSLASASWSVKPEPKAQTEWEADARADI